MTPARFEAAVRRALGRLGREPAPRAGLARAIEARRRSGKHDGYRTRFVVRRGSTHTFIPASDVVRIDAEDNYLQLHVGRGVHLVRGMMTDAERELDPAAFVRIHQSAIVSIPRIAAVESLASGGYLVHLSDGTKLRTSRQYAANIRVLLSTSRD